MKNKIFLNTVEKVKDFVNGSKRYDDLNIFLVSGRYIINAKSIMGVFSLNLLNPLDIIVEYENDIEDYNSFMKFLKKFEMK